MVVEVDSNGSGSGPGVQTLAGPFAIRGKIYAKWQVLQTEKTPDGDDVQAHLGPPLGEQIGVSAKHGGGAAQVFQRGMIVERADGRAFVVYGAIYDHYRRMGDTASILGPPTSDEEDAPAGGRVAHFENGDIYWREDVGAREVHGARRVRYAARRDPFARSWVGRAAALCRAILGLMTKSVRSTASPTKCRPPPATPKPSE
jgi:uncharacterized protein with LGFP repeats